MARVCGRELRPDADRENRLSGSPNALRSRTWTKLLLISSLAHVLLVAVDERRRKTVHVTDVAAIVVRGKARHTDLIRAGRLGRIADHSGIADSRTSQSHSTFLQPLE